MQKKYVFSDPATVKDFSAKVSSQCEVCQVSRPLGSQQKSHIVPTPIHPHLMDSVAIDLFAMPEVTHGDQNFNQVVVYVDRFSGWVVAVPCCTPGWTADRVAREMFKSWELFGIPSVICSYQGPIS